MNPNILPENVKILRGWTKDPLVMMAGIDESFDACIFTGLLFLNICTNL
ncbi:M55 family metallopeptidase [Clostridioides difficile]